MAEDKADETEGEESPPRKGSRLPMILALVLTLAGGGGGFFATYSGTLSLGPLLGEKAPKAAKSPAPQIAAKETPVFLPVGEIVVPLGPAATAQFLYVTPELEVAAADADAINAVMPRVRDMFNSYLRAVEPRDLEQPDAMTRIRAQLMRRLAVVSEDAPPRDLLFTSFILK